MGIFDKIKSAIWGKEEAVKPQPAATANPTSTPTAASATASAAPDPAPSTVAPSAPAAPSVATAQSSVSPSSTAPSTPTASPASSGSVDVAAILDAAVKENGQKLDWRHSIVDLMKALKLDSSLSARKELAGELNYTGDTSDSATMNIWLHKALMQKLAENGGKVPAELTD